MKPWLEQEEVDDLCHPLTQAAAQIRFLKSLGLTVRRKPSGDALVMRADVVALSVPTPASPSARPTPNRAGLIAAFARG
jgi:hypothetical protein